MLLFTGLANPGPLTITFDAAIFEGDVQIQSDPMEIPDYTATSEAFGSFDNPLEKRIIEASAEFGAIPAKG